MGEIMNRFAVGQLVYINDTTNLYHGHPRTIERISTMNDYPYRLDDGFWYPETEITAEPPILATQPQAGAAEWQTMDIDSGLGIGGINNDQSAPFVPSAAAIARVQHLHDTDTVCRRCGASAHFDGAMFTTLGGSNICDDCA